jgi:hypothetical protein
MEKDTQTGTSPAQDVESGREGISHWKMITDQGVTTKEIENWDYEGEGTEDDPFVVEWIDNDPRNPMVRTVGPSPILDMCLQTSDMGQDQEMGHGYRRRQLSTRRLVLFVSVFRRYSTDYGGVQCQPRNRHSWCITVRSRFRARPATVSQHLEQTGGARP